MKKILHFGDIHARDKDIDEVEKCLNFMVSVAKEEQPDLLVNAGDTFDAGGIRADSLSAKLIFKIFKELADIAPVIIITGTPSHDSNIPSLLKYISARYPIFVSERPEQIYLCKGDLNADPAKLFAPIEAVISTLPSPTKQHWNSDSSINETDAEIGAALSGIFAGFGAQAAQYDCPHILMMHCTIRGAKLSENTQMIGRDIEVGKDQIKLTNANLVCCSHIHYAQAIDKITFYSGSLFQGDSSEFGQNFGFYIHEIDTANRLQASKYIITPYTKLYAIKHDFTDSQGDFLVPFTPETLKNVRDAVVKVEIKVFEDEVAKIDREDLERNLSEAKSYDIKIIRTPRENVRSENILKLVRLRDKLTEMAKLKNEDVPEPILAKADELESMEGDEIVALAWSIIFKK